MLFQSCSFLKHKKMKKFLTFWALFLAVFFLPDSRLQAKERSAADILSMYNDCYVLAPGRTFKDLLPWFYASSSSAAMMVCPSQIDVQLGSGECGRVVNYNFNLPPLVVSPVLHNPNNSQTVNSTIYCSSGQTKYSRVFQHTGNTDLRITSLDIGVYKSFNFPLVTVNFYKTNGQLIGSETRVIDQNIDFGVYNYLISNNIVIPAQTSYKVEIVTNAPYISVFKIGRNDQGHLPGFSEAQIVAADCNVLNTEINPLTPLVNPNSIVFRVNGTPDAYRVVNTSNGYNSGDVFPIGSHAMVYTIYNAVGGDVPVPGQCAFTVNVYEFANTTGALACNDLVQVSLSENCEMIITPQMLLQGSQYGCYDKYKVQIIGVNGANLGNKVTKANIGQKLKTQIIGPNGNSCWGEILVEDKFGPDLVCEDIYATCSTDLRPGSVLSQRVPVVAQIANGTIGTDGTSVRTFTIPVANLKGTTITDLNVFIDIAHTRVSDLAANITSPDGVTVPLFLNLTCNGANIMVTLDDQSNNLNNTLQGTCEFTNPAVAGTFRPFNPLSVFNGKPLEGDWKVTIFDLVSGQSGKVNNIHLIFSQTGGKISFPTPKDVTFSQVSDKIYLVKGIDACFDATLTYTDEVVESDCASIYSKVIKRCWTGVDAKGNFSVPCCQFIYVYRNSLSTLQFPPNYDGLNGNPAPLSCSLYGTTIPPTSVTGLPTGDLCDNVQIVPPVDVKIDICKKSYKLLRTHKVVEWCSGQVIVYNQIIKVMDTQGPVMECPLDVTISTDAYACSATYTVPKPKIINECSDILTYELAYSDDDDFEEEFETANANQSTFTITGLKVGDNWVKWTVTDECHNSSVCYFKVTVEDKVLPNAVCIQFTTASISGNGKALVYATSFDNGSKDNCAIFKFEARKMTDACDFGTRIFTPYVEFCCEEVNTSVMVEFRVTDTYGNSNTCMVEVKVQDKLPPYITRCPADITLDCQADYKDLKVTGEPLYVDNCEVISVKFQDNVKINSCGVGTITRTWTVEDKQGYKNSCVQVITLINRKPFYVNQNNYLDPNDDIVWPLNYETVKCYSNLDPASLPKGYDRPVFNDDNCSLVAATYKDQVFKFVEGACEKVIRTWTVIDWCTYNESYPKLGQGWYEYIQIIKLKNDIPPIFEFACVDRTFASYGNCEDVIDFTMTAVDDCPENNTNLVWKYELFTEYGTVPIAVVNSDRFFRTLANGRYRIKWTVEDKCGNRAFCTQYINVLESKKPTPYCLSSITTAVMNSNGTISIWAKDYDLGAYDNCTPQNQLLFTFYGALPVDSLINKEHYFKGKGRLATKAEYEAGVAQIWVPAKKTSGIVFSCADIPNGVSQEVSVEVWVTDLAGNQDYCTVTIVLQDNADVCPDGGTSGIGIAGRAFASGNNMKGADVIIQSNRPEQNKTIKTDANGIYSFSGLPKTYNYSISMTDNRNIMNGVSTLDLVLIQRHILGLEVLNDPKKIIAADVDNNEKVTASDLLYLRKTILGIENEFPNGQKSWRFITSNHVFTNPVNPFPFSEKYVFNQLTESKINQNFYGVKIGDVNNSAIINFNDPGVEDRSFRELILETEPITSSVGGEILVPVYAGNFEDIFGYQFTMQFDPKRFEFIDVTAESLKLNESNFGLNRTQAGIITTSWNADVPLTVTPGHKLFTLKFRAIKETDITDPIQITSSVTPAVGFDGEYQLMKITLNNRTQETDNGFELMQNKPNPFNESTIITFRLRDAGNAKITISDITGKVVKLINGQYAKGLHTIELNKSELGSSGVLLYKIESGKYTDTKKMIIIE
jgi:subtilisin-like proprotein convertase family protein